MSVGYSLQLHVALLVKVKLKVNASPREYFFTGSSTSNAHTRPLDAPERAERSSNMHEQEVVPSKVLRPKGPGPYIQL